MAYVLNDMPPGMSADEAFDEELSDDDVSLGGSSNKKARRSAAGSKSKSKQAASSSHDIDDGNGSAAAASARKLQNRVAQREFRQRKLQYVKDLEARVEFLSGSKDDQLEALKAMLRGLLEENKRLRTLLQTVSAFVGEGLGGNTHRLGFGNVTDFEEFVNRSDMDTIHRIHEGWKTKYSKQTKVDSGVGQNSNDSRMSPTTAAGTPDLLQAPNTQSSKIQASPSQSSARKRGRPSDAAKETAGADATSTTSSQMHVTGNMVPNKVNGIGTSSDTTISASQIRTPATVTPPISMRMGAMMPFASSQQQYQFATEALLNTNAAAAPKLMAPQAPSFFFDAAKEPMSLQGDSATSSPFTADFMAEFAHTGFTPAPVNDGSLGAFNWPDFAILPTSTPAPYGMLTNPMDNVVTTSSGQADVTPPADTAEGDIVISNLSNMTTSGMSPDAVINSSPLLQAIHLLSYHMRNKAANPAYLLPPSLAPTQSQILIPHDSRIDGIIWPQLRDRLIASNIFDTNIVLADLLEAVTVHPSEDLLDFNNWELTEAFLHKYQALTTPDMLSSTNRWRKSRGDSVVSM